MHVAAGAGSHYVSDGYLRRWDVTVGAPLGPPIQAHNGYVHFLSRILLRGREVLVTYGPPGMLKIWRPADGALLAEIATGISSKVTGFAAGLVDGRPFVALSSYRQPMRLHALEDSTENPITIPEAGNGVVLGIVGSHIVAGHFEHERMGLHTIRMWNISGRKVGPDIRGEAEVTTVAGRTWPTAYIGRADGTVSLTDLVTGRDLCNPCRLPSRPRAMTVTDSGDLVVGFGSDLARIRPPVP